MPRSIHRGESSSSIINSSKPQNLVKTRPPSLALLDDYLRSPPPHKRPRSSEPIPPTLSNNRVSIRTHSEDLENSRTVRTDLLNLKEEPLDECDVDDGDAEQEAVMLSENGKSGTESLMQLVKAESSQNSSSQAEGMVNFRSHHIFNIWLR